MDDSSGKPVLHVPGMTYPQAQPYHTNVAKVGDTVKFVKDEGRLVIVPSTAPPPEPVEPPAELTLTAIDPTAGEVDSGNLAIVVTGTGFDDTCKIVFGG